ncbi:MAG TPA: V-type ATPase subunit [Candidatus Aminicenantes bacterium]|nr:V-type ATPase subunit [Candidatus Aminicenantes bacterium]
MKHPSPLQYAYAIGRVRALENFLVGRDVFREAADAPDFQSALKMISDAGRFGGNLTGIKDSEDLDDVLAAEEERLFVLLDEILLDREVLEVIRLLRRPEQAFESAGKTDSGFIRDYVRHLADLGNLKMFARAKYLGLAAASFEGMALGGGFMGKEVFLAGYGRPLRDLGPGLDPRYRPLWEKAVLTLEERETFVALESGIEDFLMTYLRRAKYMVFGPEPVFSYALAKQRELGLVRLVGIGKINLIPAERIKERVSETYV